MGNHPNHCFFFSRNQFFCKQILLVWFFTIFFCQVKTIFLICPCKQFVFFNTWCKMEEHLRFEADSVFVTLLTRKKDQQLWLCVDLNDALSRYKIFDTANRNNFSKDQRGRALRGSSPHSEWVTWSSPLRILRKVHWATRLAVLPGFR